MKHPHYRPDIDGLRAVAILSVVGYHAFPAYLKGGFVGVDIFFVISGYLISTIIFSNLRNDQFSFREFYARRIKRIFPALLTVLTAFFFIGWFSLFADEYAQLGKHITGGAFFISNLMLLQEVSYFDAAAETKPLLHLWSLAIEEQYYIIWPLLVVLFWRRARLLPWLIALVIGASFLYSLSLVESAPSRAFYLPHSRFWELLAGSALAYLIHKQHLTTHAFAAKPWLRDGYASLGALLLLAPLLLIDSKMPFPGWLALLPVSGAVIVIHAGTEARPNRWLLANRFMIWIGLISYPLYLWHWPVLTFSLFNGIGEEAHAARALLMVASVALAWATYKWVERPLRFSTHPLLGTRALFALLMVLGIVGFATYDQAGFRQRSFNQQSAHLDVDVVKWYRQGRCFIETKAGAQAFAPQCDTLLGRDSGKPLVLLWGDSHAASLLPGLMNQAEQNGFDIAQFNANGCPPVRGFVANTQEPLCPAINEFVAAKVESLNPQLVILGGYWINYSGEGKWNPLDLAQLKQSIELLRKAKREVVVVGQLPVAEYAQPNIAARLFEPAKVNRTRHHFLSAQFALDKRLREVAEAAGAHYLSPTGLLCNSDGCLLSTSSETLIPLAWDYGHLTQAGSIYLFEQAVARGLLTLPQAMSTQNTVSAR